VNTSGARNWGAAKSSVIRGEGGEGEGEVNKEGGVGEGEGWKSTIGTSFGVNFATNDLGCIQISNGQLRDFKAIVVKDENVG